MKICLSTSTNEKGAYDVQCHFHQYFSYIVAVSFIAGGNQKIPLFQSYNTRSQPIPYVIVRRSSLLETRHMQVENEIP